MNNIDLKNPQKILFFGELPPKTVHGTSISNSINLAMLARFYDLHIIEEYSELKFHEKFTFSKLSDFVKRLKLHFMKCVRITFHKFYGVVYLSTFGIIKNLILVIIFKLFNPFGEVILHFHRSDFPIFIQSQLNRFLFFILDLLVDKYIILSDLQKNQLGKIDGDKIHVLPNTIEKEYLEKDLIVAEKQSKFDLSIIYVGNFIREKGVTELINAVNILNLNGKYNIALNLFGNYTSPLFKKELELLVCNSRNIIFHGPIVGIDKFNKIYNSDVVALPSYNEGLPLILLESLHVGTPILISKVGYIEDALGLDYPLYCEPRSVNSIINKIENIIESKNLNIDFKSIYSRFSNNSHLQTLVKIFEA